MSFALICGYDGRFTIHRVCSLFSLQARDVTDTLIRFRKIQYVSSISTVRYSNLGILSDSTWILSREYCNPWYFVWQGLLFSYCLRNPTEFVFIFLLYRLYPSLCSFIMCFIWCRISQNNVNAFHLNMLWMSHNWFFFMKIWLCVSFIVL